MDSATSEKQELPVPFVGSNWRDYKYPDRMLTVTRIQVPDYLDRNVVGHVRWRGVGFAYSCSLKTFQVIWRPL